MCTVWGGGFRSQSYLAADSHIRHGVSSRSNTPSSRYGNGTVMDKLASFAERVFRPPLCDSEGSTTYLLAASTSTSRTSTTVVGNQPARGRRIGYLPVLRKSVLKQYTKCHALVIGYIFVGEDPHERRLQVMVSGAVVRAASRRGTTRNSDSAFNSV